MKRIIVYIVSVVAIGVGITMVVCSKINPSLTEGSNPVMAGISFIVIGLLLVLFAK